MEEVKELLDRIKSMDYHEVVVPIPPAVFYLNGKIPFSFKVDDYVMSCSVLAASYEEASEKVRKFFNPDD